MPCYFSNGSPAGSVLTTQRKALVNSRFCTASINASVPWPFGVVGRIAFRLLGTGSAYDEHSQQGEDKGFHKRVAVLVY